MNKADRDALFTFPFLLFIGFIIALAGSQGGSTLGDIPIFAVGVGLAFLIQWLVFIPAFLLRSEKFFDLTGSLTYISIISFALIFSTKVDARAIILGSLVIIWAVRLGSFLFRRIRRAGKDERFDGLKSSFLRFLLAWTMQGLWVTFTVAAALAGITTILRKNMDVFAISGVLLWVFGFIFEVIADSQKSRFNSDSANKSKFIQSGLWSCSRHPNYFGEITLWLGIAIMALPVLRGWQLTTLLSPVFVTFLLTRISGISLLEKKADLQWGGQNDYETYKKRTPVLIPRLKGDSMPDEPKSSNFHANSK
jgi:steroid 5-alpha reductase family enzyme